MGAFGNSTPSQWTYGQIGVNNLRGADYQLTEGPVTLSKVSAYLKNSVTGSVRVIALIYRDSDKALVGVSNPTDVTEVQEWYDFSFPSTLTLTAGYYWLHLACETGIIKFYFGPNVVTAGFSSNVPNLFTDPPSIMPALTAETKEFCIYATYELPPTDVTLAVQSNLDLPVASGVPFDTPPLTTPFSQGPFPIGTQVTLTAPLSVTVGSDLYTFQRFEFSDGQSTTSNSIIVTLNSNLTVTAIYATMPTTVTLMLASSPLGVTFITPSGSTPFEHPQSPFAVGTLVTLEVPRVITISGQLYNFARYESDVSGVIGTDPLLSGYQINSTQTITAVYTQSGEIKVFETDFSSGSLTPMEFTPFSQGTYVFADPLGIGRNGVVLSMPLIEGGRSSLRYPFPQTPPLKLGIARVRFQISFPDLDSLRDICYLMNSNFYGQQKWFMRLYVNGTEPNIQVSYLTNAGEVKGTLTDESGTKIVIQPNYLYEIEVVYKIYMSIADTGYVQIRLREVYPTPSEYPATVAYAGVGIVTNFGVDNFIDTFEVGMAWTIPSGTAPVVDSIYYVGFWQVSATLVTKDMYGKVTDLNGNPLADVCVAVGTNEDPSSTIVQAGAATARTLTNDSGNYALSVMMTTADPSVFIAEAFNPYYYQKVRELVTLSADTKLEKNFQLTPQICCEPSIVYSGTEWKCRCACIFPYWFEYDSDNMDICLNDLADQIPSVNTIDIRRLYEADLTNANRIVQAPNASFTLAKLQAATKKCHDRGYRVRLGLVCYGNYPIVGNGVTYFESYKQFCIESATWCQTNHVEELCVAWEAYWIDTRLEDGTFNAQWQDIIDSCRVVAPDVLLTWQSQEFFAFEGSAGIANTFLRSLDYISASVWARLTYNADASYSELVTAYSNAPDAGNILQSLLNIYSTYNKKILVNFGFQRQWCAILRPWGGGSRFADDEGEQAIAYKAWFDAHSAPAVESILYGVLFEHFDDPMEYGVTTGTCRNCFASRQGIIEAGLKSHAAITVTISGTVKASNEAGQLVGLADVAVSTPGYEIAYTDANGLFTLSVNTRTSPPYVLTFAKVGYNTKTSDPVTVTDNVDIGEVIMTVGGPGGINPWMMLGLGAVAVAGVVYVSSRSKKSK